MFVNRATAHDLGHFACLFLYGIYTVRVQPECNRPGRTSRVLRRFPGPYSARNSGMLLITTHLVPFSEGLGSLISSISTSDYGRNGNLKHKRNLFFGAATFSFASP